MGTASPPIVNGTDRMVRSAPVWSVRMRTAPGILAGSYEHHAVEPVSAWHEHDLHEIEYAVSGLAEIETESSHYLLPPRHAAWIPAGVPHAPHLRHVHTIAVFFDPAAFAHLPARAAILPVSPVLREMIRYATRWPIGRPSGGGSDDDEASAFFTALAGVVAHQFAHEAPRSLPVSDDAVIAEVMAYTATHLQRVTAAEVGRAVGISPRSLRRRFTAVVGQTWRDYLQQARLFRAMALLSEPGPTVRDVAMTVGFDSASAFTRAFQAWTGETPSAYRVRCGTSSPDGP